MKDPEQLLRQAEHFARTGNRNSARQHLLDLAAHRGVSPNLLLPAAFQAYQIGELDLAEQCLRKIIRIAPNFGPAYTNLGNILRETGQLEEAIEMTETACELAPGDVMNFANLGGLQEENQRPDKAEVAYREALDRMPGEPGLMDSLGRVLLKLARPGEAMSVLKTAVEKAPGLVSAHINIGNLYQEAEQLAPAATAYETALNLEPSSLLAGNNLALVRLRQGRLDEAEAGFKMITKMAPGNPLAFNNLAQTQFQKGALTAALEACEGALACDPGNRTALANKIIILNDIPNQAAVSYLQDLELFVTTQHIPVPEGFSSSATFNDALFAEVDAEPDRFSEKGQAQGRQTRNIMLEPGPAVRAYSDAMNNAVRHYMDELHDDPAHPFFAGRPDTWRLEAWGTFTQQVSSGEDTHIHPDAWLSGVYYPRLPAAVQNQADTDGYLEIGRAPNHMAQRIVPKLKVVRPEMGLLVLFPSYFYHRVLPFKSPETRMSVAFDAVPI